MSTFLDIILKNHLHNLHGEGHSWKENQVSREKVMSLNSRIGKGSNEVWEELESQLQQAVASGFLKQGIVRLLLPNIM